MTRLLAVVGPTCTGKTTLAVALARRLAPAELLNADSRQLRRGLVVGTCAPTTAELGEVRCHLLELAGPGDTFTVADWVRAARTTLADLGQRGVRPILVGGTGLYVSALVDGYDLGEAPPEPARRAELQGRAASPEGRAGLVEELTRRDPEAASVVDTRNPRRVIRALEILDAHAGPLRAARGTAPIPAVMIGLDVDRETHEQWIARRCAGMFSSGALLEEARGALAGGCSPEALAACGIGYAEALGVLAGRLDVDSAIAATVHRTLRYAKAQRTYFRRDRRIAWLSGTRAGGDQTVDEAAALASGLAA